MSEEKKLSERIRDEANIIWNSERQHFGQVDLAVFTDIATKVEALEEKSRKWDLLLHLLPEIVILLEDIESNQKS